ncbi:TPA: protein translocase subunit SecD [Candidatus Shapirobacteria bacterium]|uniref:Protein translocase subunit SecD n=1 Tax=Candidatus Shapirobacteria bacterium GW2011_GWE2_38_30 TaxID=1618490 RepID=A0A0G0MCN9_9BACT|nr:MAG: Preprotein translocase subunit SecD [Candidatus Shapirobacteria bacterium GW2011_GWE2_38_30]HAP37819.1 protein translocase subunit SecD [Candidatus Shapirobacteria bacterium]HCU55411.1 protein translocase subunit SecD [Candidatus Shapirobacteria bacterium]
MPINSRTKKIFWIILSLAFISLIIDMPQKVPVNIRWKNFNWQHTFYRPQIDFNLGSLRIYKSLDLKYGLDLAGGASITFEADTSKIKKEDLPQALESLKTNIERRVNLFGVSESNVQLSSVGDKNRLIVELPGVENVDEAIDLIGQTAQLSFKGVEELPPEATASATLDDILTDTGINGSHLVKAAPQPNPNTGQMEVSLEFDQEGAKLFSEATKKYLNKRIAIMLDDEIVSAPTVSTQITDGLAVINGNFDTKSAKTLSAQLNAGALPIPIKLIQQSQVGASLGRDSIDKGVRAGLIGLVIVTLFMVANYGKLGLIANISLLIYGLITLALYKLIPVTLTFPGIVGFILSIGMAVDSNILIFERMKEELRSGKPWTIAMELGFGRAWDSIKDANTATIITGLILFNPFNWSFLNSSGMVRGFAVTLLIGIFLSMFTGVIVTRNLLRVLAHEKLDNQQTKI